MATVCPLKVSLPLLSVVVLRKIKHNAIYDRDEDAKKRVLLFNNLGTSTVRLCSVSMVNPPLPFEVCRSIPLSR